MIVRWSSRVIYGHRIIEDVTRLGSECSIVCVRIDDGASGRDVLDGLDDLALWVPGEAGGQEVGAGDGYGDDYHHPDQGFSAGMFEVLVVEFLIRQDVGVGCDDRQGDQYQCDTTVEHGQQDAADDATQDSTIDKY